MKSIVRKIELFVSVPRNVPWLFLAVAVIAYGLLFWRHGFYWDDLPMAWIRYELGPEALTKYFSTARPVWAVLYQITTAILPPVPMVWQVFSILWRWLGVVILWRLLRELWPDHEAMGILAGLFFLLYPGFNLQWASFLTTHFYIVICFFLLSYLLMLWAIKMPGRYWLFTSIALVLSALNLWMLEFFYFLELIRFFIILYVLVQSRQGQGLMQTSRRAFLQWLPYLLVFIVNVSYRVFVFTNVAYQNVLLAEMRLDPVGATIDLIKQIVFDLWLVLVEAWSTILQFPNIAVDGPLTTLMYVFAIVAVGVLTLIFFMYRRVEPVDRRPLFWAVGLGFVAILLGGGPYWLATLDVSLVFPASRFTMSFMLGVSVFLAGLIELLPFRIRITLIVLLVAFAAGRQVMNGDSFLRDWESQKNLFRQMTWRAPGLKLDTLVLMNEELSYYADNSISAAVNWIYDSNASASDINYVLFYPTNRLGKSLPSLEPDIPVRFSYIAGDFNGNTSQTVAFYYEPPYCLRLLDPDLDGNNRFILDDSLMREASALSNPDRILREPSVSLPDFYGPEPAHGWCYYFQKAELARQFNDWDEVKRLGDAAFSLDEHFNNPVELFVFIEGRAHVGEWDEAIRLSKEARQVSKSYVDPLLCKLWKRIEAETAPGVKKGEVLEEIITLASCE